MPQTAAHQPPSAAAIEFARTTAVDGRRITVATSYGPLEAVKAAGCLLVPAPGDRVLVAWDTSGRAFVLSVLERADQSGVNDLDFDGSVRLRAGGDLCLDAGRDLAASAQGELALNSDHLNVRAQDGQLEIGRASFWSRAVEARVERIQVLAQTVDHVFRTLTQRLKNAFRQVEDHEEIQTGSTRHLVEDHLMVTAKNAEHQAEETIQLTAGQIHMR